MYTQQMTTETKTVATFSALSRMFLINSFLHT